MFQLIGHPRNSDVHRWPLSLALRPQQQERSKSKLLVRTKQSRFSESATRFRRRRAVTSAASSSSSAVSRCTVAKEPAFSRLFCFPVPPALQPTLNQQNPCWACSLAQSVQSCFPARTPSHRPSCTDHQRQSVGHKCRCGTARPHTRRGMRRRSNAAIRCPRSWPPDPVLARKRYTVRVASNRALRITTSPTGPDLLAPIRSWYKGPGRGYVAAGSH